MIELGIFIVFVGLGVLMYTLLKQAHTIIDLKAENELLKEREKISIEDLKRMKKIQKASDEFIEANRRSFSNLLLYMFNKDVKAAVFAADHNTKGEVEIEHVKDVHPEEVAEMIQVLKTGYTVEEFNDKIIIS